MENLKKTKVTIQYSEIQFFQRNFEIELTKKELKEFKKTGKLSFELENKMCSETDLKFHVVTVPIYKLVTNK